MNTKAAHTTNCHRCGRVLTSATSVARGYGRTCKAKVTAAAKVINLTAYKASQIADAQDLIDEGAIVPLRGRIYLAVSSDGARTYRTAPEACNCAAGLKGRSVCFHRIAATILSLAA